MQSSADLKNGWQTKHYRKIHKLNSEYNQKSTIKQTIAKQNYPGSVASYDTRPENQILQRRRTHTALNGLCRTHSLILNVIRVLVGSIGREYSPKHRGSYIVLFFSNHTNWMRCRYIDVLFVTQNPRSMPLSSSGSKWR